jgi:para-aminobenzoate synthetase/4-amino-4-deoxychorismate lyase
MTLVAQPFTAENSAVLYDAQQGCWLGFSDPIQVLTAHTTADIQALLDTVQQTVEREGYYAVGFLSYEASPAFDPSFQVKSDDCFPLAWFGFYRHACPILPPTVNATTPFSLAWTPSISRVEYQQALSKIKRYIAEGITYQVNYSFRLQSPFKCDPWLYFWQINHAQNSLYSAFINLKDWAICCASPELFFQWDEGKLLCQPMKGTAPRGLTYQRDRAVAKILQTSPKERAENVMIADMIRNDLGRIAQTGSVRVNHLFKLEQYPTVWQMTSPVECTTQANLSEIFTALFPCASIVGAPKASTLKIIAELETLPRRIYTGTIGFLRPNCSAQFNVAIRTVLVNKSENVAEYGVGGGIVWDSLETNEYEECCTKAKILSRQQPQFSLLESILWTPEKGYFLIDLHLKRLQESAAYFNFTFNLEKIRDRLAAIALTLPPQAHKVRLLCHKQDEITLNSEPLISASRPLFVGLASSPIDITNPFLYHKTTHRLIYEKMQQSHPQYDDVLLWNEKGELTEFCAANLVVETPDGKWYTPPVECGLLAGTFRTWLLQQNRLHEKIIPVSELSSYSRVFRVNSVRQIQEVYYKSSN